MATLATVYVPRGTMEKLRRHVSQSVEAAAKKVHATEEEVGAWEAGTADPPLAALRDLAVLDKTDTNRRVCCPCERSQGGQMQRLLQVVLSAWREAERVAAERSEGSQEHTAALTAADRLRELYGELLESAKADNDMSTVAGSSPLSDLDPA